MFFLSPHQFPTVTQTREADAHKVTRLLSGVHALCLANALAASREALEKSLGSYASSTSATASRS